MATNVCLILAVISWLAGALNLSYTNNSVTPPKTYMPNWLCLGLFFAGLGLWIMPLI